ncbi:MAG: triose-phosphate isomerase [Epsilonproteobacteria bacterium]|nr:triose-phosphate isomerase [Campylobacterota bacterium]
MIIASNFKMNHTRKSTQEFLDKLSTVSTEHTIRVYPPCTALCANPIVGAQNGYPAVEGSYTAEIGLRQISEFGIDKILLGHSERRQFGESQEFIARKFDFYKNENFEIMYCIGEPLEVRKQSKEAVIAYLKQQLQGIDLEYERLIIAYEPVWAIGTGVSATIEEIRSTHDALRELTNKALLYGGSVKLENIAQICAIDNVDGCLIGTASWDVDNFIEMIKRV